MFLSVPARRDLCYQVVCRVTQSFIQCGVLFIVKECVFIFILILSITFLFL